MQVAKKKWYEGRQGRVQFLKCQVISLLVGMVFIATPSIIEIIFPMQRSAMELIQPSFDWFAVFSTFIYLIAVGLSSYISFPSICKRLHDLELSAKWLPVYFVCNMVLYGLPLILLSVLPGNKETNKYGEIPK